MKKAKSIILIFSKRWIQQIRKKKMRHILCAFVLVAACVCVRACVTVLTMWGDCLYGLALASDVPYGQSSVRVTANELLALVMPGN